jgi:hypothetical protein
MELTLDDLAERIHDEMITKSSAWRLEDVSADDARLRLLLSSVHFSGPAEFRLNDPRPEFTGPVTGDAAPSVSDWIAEVWEYIDEGLATRRLKLTTSATPYPVLTFDD